ncbi:hypothetical protein [Flexivirga sp. B27]
MDEHDRGLDRLDRLDGLDIESHLPHRILALLSMGGIAVFVMICALAVLSDG